MTNLVLLRFLWSELNKRSIFNDLESPSKNSLKQLCIVLSCIYRRSKFWIWFASFFLTFFKNRNWKIDTKLQLAGKIQKSRLGFWLGNQNQNQMFGFLWVKCLIRANCQFDGLKAKNVKNLKFASVLKVKPNFSKFSDL